MKIFKKRGIQVFIFKDKKIAAKEFASFITKEIIKKKKFNLGLASGKTMIPIYRELVSLYNKKYISFTNVNTFDIDEYLNTDKKNTFEFFLKKHFLSKVNVKEKNQYFLRVGKDIEKICKDYEDKIKTERIDLQLLGIGKNGHIAFNEPGSSFESRTRKIKLRDETRISNRIFFNNSDEVPLYALTTGIGTILDARKIILFAFGTDKSEAVHKALENNYSTKNPASALQKHQDTKFVLDSSSSSLLNLH